MIDSLKNLNNQTQQNRSKIRKVNEDRRINSIELETAKILSMGKQMEKAML